MCVIDCRIVAVLANMIVLSPYATQDLATMARHHVAYDHSVVALQILGERHDHLLCAHVESTRWLCHRGSFLEGHIDINNPFDPADIVDMDIVRDAWSEDGGPTHGITQQTKFLHQTVFHP